MAWAWGHINVPVREGQAVMRGCYAGLVAGTMPARMAKEHTMTAAMSGPDAQRAGHPMSGAELRCFTESLGLSVAFLAKRWNIADTGGEPVSEKRIKNWMKGQAVPAWVADDVDAMVEDTERLLDTLVAVLPPGSQLPTYRSDTEYREHLGEQAIYNANWHRMLCTRATDEVDDVQLVWAVPPRSTDGDWDGPRRG